MKTINLTTAQAVIRFLEQQFVERDGKEQAFFAGCFGIFGHGNVGGIGQALFEQPTFKYYQSRNEQAMVHSAAAYSRMKNRLSTFACTSSIGPGATNMLTAAASATINRLPVLLLPGDIFASRHVDPVLQQLEMYGAPDVSVNDCFRPISKFWDRIARPEQLIASLPQAMRVLTSPADTGTATLCLPQDVQAEVYEFPERLFSKRIWYVPRPLPDGELLQRAADRIRTAKRPLIIAGGGVIYSEATESLLAFVNETGMPVAETFAGKGSLRYDEPHNLGAVGATGTEGANAISAEADLIIGIGTRYSDFTTASKTAFQNEHVDFVNINIAEFDAHKQSGLALTGDARAILDNLTERLKGYRVAPEYQETVAAYNRSWDEKVSLAYQAENEQRLSQAEIIGLVNAFSGPKDVVLCAAGSLPGDLHKLWRTENPKGFHLEYGYSCMGYEIAGGLGAKMACPDREIYVMVGDGSYLMMSSEIVTSIQEEYKITIILINNHGYASIGGLSKSLGTEGFGTSYRYRDRNTGQLDGAELPVDLAQNAASLGAEVIHAHNSTSFGDALVKAKSNIKTTVIYIESTPERKLAGYGHAWWEVPVAALSEKTAVKIAYEKQINNKVKQRHHL